MNTVVLSLDKHPIDPGMETAIEYTNVVFTAFFMIEMILKLLGLGFQSYFRYGQNIFDCVIVLLSTADVGIFLATEFSTYDFGFFLALGSVS